MTIAGFVIPSILGIVILLDVGLMLYARRVIGKARIHRSLVRDLPSVPFAAVATIARMVHSEAMVDEIVGAIFVLLVGTAMILWEILDGFPVHPLVAAAVGAVTGMVFWPL